MSATFGCTSPTIIEPRLSNAARRAGSPGNIFSTAALVSRRLIPTSITAAPGFTNAFVTNPGRPIAATRISASAASLGRSAVREWATVTVACRCSRSSAIGLPTMSLRPMTSARAPAIGMPERSRISITPDGVHATSVARFWTR